MPEIQIQRLGKSMSQWMSQCLGDLVFYHWVSLYLGASKKVLTKLQSIQNAAASLVLNLPKRTSTTKTLINLHWLPVEKKILFKAMCYCHWILSKRGTRYLRQLIAPYAPSRNLRSKGRALVTVPRKHKARTGARSFRYLAANTWNTLPADVRAEPCETTFCKNLKTWLLPQSNQSSSTRTTVTCP